MLKDARVIGFVLTTDYAAARAFYVGKLGLEFVSQDEYALVLRSGANMVRVSKVREFSPAQHTVLGWEVSDVPARVEALRGLGVELEKFPWIRDASGIMTFPNGDKVAWFRDPDGNLLSVSSHG